MFITAITKKESADVIFLVLERPWKMYPLGVLFGLGFDTSSEIALLGISSIEATRLSNFWVILIFPILFTGKFRFFGHSFPLMEKQQSGLC